MPAKKAKRPSRRSAGAGHPGPFAVVPPSMLPPMPSGAARPETTGHFIVVLRDSAVASASAARSKLNSIAGIRHVASSKDFTAGVTESASLAGAEALHFESLGVVVVDDADAAAALAQTVSNVDSPVLVIEPEYIAHP